MKVGVLISGRGSNFEALLKATREPGYPAEIVLVISNKADAGGLEIAKAAGIPTCVISHKDYESREAFDAAMDAELVAAGVELVCNAGFMRILSEWFVAKWRDRQLNIHPSLLPSFKGLHVHQRTIDAGVRITGATVHFVRAEMDEGPIVAQAAVAVLPDDTADILAARVLKAEHVLYPLALKLVASGAARVAGERVLIQGEGDVVSGPLFVPMPS